MQRSEGGLYVDMTSFLGFGRNPVYLHIMQRRKPEPDDEADHPLKKPTLLSIGMSDSAFPLITIVYFILLKL